MGRVPYSEFEGSRARFQRLSDQHVFSGWLNELKNSAVEVTAEENLRIQPGERFLFQVQGPSADAYFIAQATHDPIRVAPNVFGATARKVAELPALSYGFELITQIQMRDAQQLARKIVRSMAATVDTRGKTVEVLITDASAGGMGVIAWEELAEGDVVGVNVESDAFKGSFHCEVRHCRPEERLIGAYRVGLQFQKPDRITAVSWRKLITPL